MGGGRLGDRLAFLGSLPSFLLSFYEYPHIITHTKEGKEGVGARMSRPRPEDPSAMKSRRRLKEQPESERASEPRRRRAGNSKQVAERCCQQLRGRDGRTPAGSGRAGQGRAGLGWLGYYRPWAPRRRLAFTPVVGVGH